VFHWVNAHAIAAIAGDEKLAARLAQRFQEGRGNLYPALLVNLREMVATPHENRHWAARRREDGTLFLNRFLRHIPLPTTSRTCHCLPLPTTGLHFVPPILATSLFLSTENLKELKIIVENVRVCSERGKNQNRRAVVRAEAKHLADDFTLVAQVCFETVSTDRS
jgi:hypothetical protein